MTIEKGAQDDENVCDIGYYVRIPVAYTDGVNQYVIEGFVDGEYPYCYSGGMAADFN